jgi:hypothetical protein
MVRLLGAQQTYRAALTRRFLRGTTEGPWRAVVQGGVQNPEAFCVVGSEPKSPVAMDMTMADAHAVVALFNAAHLPALRRRGADVGGPGVGWAEFRARHIADGPSYATGGSFSAKLHSVASAMSGAAVAYEIAEMCDVLDDSTVARCAAALGDVARWLALAEHAIDHRSSFDPARDQCPLGLGLAGRAAVFAGCVAQIDAVGDMPWCRAQESLDSVACEIARRADALGGLEVVLVAAVGGAKKGGA